MSTTVNKVERAKAHLATCMERDDFPSHNCACDCDDVSELLAEVEALRAALNHLGNAYFAYRQAHPAHHATPQEEPR